MAAHDSPTDATLLGGDAHAFAAFYRRHEDAVLVYFLRRVSAPDLAADLAAETFAGALAGRSRFDPQLGEGRGWLFGIARHVLTRSLERGRVDDDVRRRLQMEPLVLLDSDLARIDELGATSATDVLGRLPVDQATAIHGRVVEERTYAELAAALRCSESVVRQRVSRGLQTLRATFKELR